MARGGREIHALGNLAMPHSDMRCSHFSNDTRSLAHPFGTPDMVHRFSALLRSFKDRSRYRSDCLVGFISNLIGSLFFMLAKAEKENEEE